MKRLNHILIIPDGNRTYAREYLERRVEGSPEECLLMAYIKGAQNLDSILRYVLENDVAGILSIYAIQPSNLQRRAYEINAMLQAEIEQFEEWSKDKKLLADVKFRFAGNLKLLETTQKGQVYQEVAKTLEESSNGQKLDVFVLASYDSEWEINESIRNRLIDEPSLAVSLDYLIQASREGIFKKSTLIVPTPVDLVIRTSGIRRLSGAIPLQAENAEYVDRHEYFPAFSIPQFKGALAEFYRRTRTFGK